MPTPNYGFVFLFLNISDCQPKPHSSSHVEDKCKWLTAFQVTTHETPIALLLTRVYSASQTLAPRGYFIPFLDTNLCPFTNALLYSPPFPGEEPGNLCLTSVPGDFWDQVNWRKPVQSFFRDYLGDVAGKQVGPRSFPQPQPA